MRSSPHEARAGEKTGSEPAPLAAGCSPPCCRPARRRHEAIAVGRGLWAYGGAFVSQGPRTATVPQPQPTAAKVTPVPDAQPPQRAPTGGNLVLVAVDKHAEHADSRNTGGATVDLKGWVLHSERGNQDCLLSGSIAPGQTVRIFAMTAEGRFNCGLGENIWNNSEPAAAVLLAPDGSEVSRY